MKKQPKIAVKTATKPAIIEGTAAAMRKARGQVLRFTTGDGLVVLVDLRG